ncbi:MAG: glutathione S-transferase N-terminal domain-containing protein [Candidatus Omnitrophica bacterium]|nr:glutathione S-transferase N-terminal domain-containing protein [Candidatus Omnitrophota bacterium]
METLELFHRPMCPYCRKVLNFVEENNIPLGLKDVSGNAEHYQELMKIGGKSQVPCLSINGKALYESDDIIQWLKDNGQSS